MCINLTGEKMNHLMKLLTLTIILHNASCYSAMTTATIVQEIITSSSITMSNLYVINDMQSYTTGGITFTYPVGLFTLPPIALVSVQSNISHPVTEAYVAEISANSASSTTIMLYRISSGVVSEAANGAAMISLLAIADPV